MTFFDYLKNIVIFLIFVQLTPIMIQNIKKQYHAIVAPKSRVGVIKVDGLLNHSSWYAKQLHTFFKDNTIKAIILKIESSGSAAGTGQALCNEILALKNEYSKPIISLTENICTSGAYYIASATDHIIASGQAVVGSIGSYMPHLFQLHDFLQEHHIDYKAIKGGRFKGITDPFINIDDADRAQLQSVVDSSYEQFVNDIAHNRNLAIENASVWAEGKLFTGKQALALNLVDELGSGYHAMAYIKQRIGIDAEIEWIHAQPHTSWLQNLLDHDDSCESGSLFNDVGLEIATLIRKCQKHIQPNTSLSALFN